MSLEDKSLDTHLQKILSSADRSELREGALPALLRCIHDIGLRLRSSQQVAAVGSSNAFGDEQLNVDVIAEKIIRDKIELCPSIVTASSEEDPVERTVSKGNTAVTPTSTEQYTIAFDPLDGSSIIAPNWTVGTIIGVWDGSSALHSVPAVKQIASLLGVYGPRTTAFVAIRVPGGTPTCFEVGFGHKEEVLSFEVIQPSVKMLAGPFKTRYFAPANLRAAAEDAKYLELVTHYMRNKYTIRYSGGLVPDLVHALVKGHGIYISPVTSASKAKLRRLFELVPVALIMECSGASAVDPMTGEHILSRPIGDCDERAGLICGTTEEVVFVKQSLGLS